MKVSTPYLISDRTNPVIEPRSFYKCKSVEIDLQKKIIIIESDVVNEENWSRLLNPFVLRRKITVGEHIHSLLVKTPNGNYLFHECLVVGIIKDNPPKTILRMLPS